MTFRPRLVAGGAALTILCVATVERVAPGAGWASDLVSAALAILAALFALLQFWVDARVDQNLDRLDDVEPPKDMHGVKRRAWIRGLEKRKKLVARRRYEMVYYVVIMIITSEIVALL